jgi:carbamate kinase
VAPERQYFRRVVPSPVPEAIVELNAIERLLVSGAVVVCAGGGGVPVVREGALLRGVEAVIDKDRTAALLAESIGAGRLVLATDVPFVERDWGTPNAAPVGAATPEELRAIPFASGSIGPKVEAACRFVERTGGSAAIGPLDELAQLVRGTAGTQISLDPVALGAP